MRKYPLHSFISETIINRHSSCKLCVNSNDILFTVIYISMFRLLQLSQLYLHSFSYMEIWEVWSINEFSIGLHIFHKFDNHTTVSKMRWHSTHNVLVDHPGKIVFFEMFCIRFRYEKKLVKICSHPISMFLCISWIYIRDVEGLVEHPALDINSLAINVIKEKFPIVLYF